MKAGLIPLRLLPFLLSMVICAGCASLKPSASVVAPENEGGIEVSEQTADFIGCFGYVLYIAGQICAGNHP